MPHSFASSRGMILLRRLSVGGVFILAGLAKLSAFASFQYSLEQMGWVPMTPIAATGVIALELMAGSMLLFGIRVREAAALAAGMLLIFAFVLTQSLVRGNELPCGCFGSFGPSLPARWQIVLDLFLVLVALSLTSRREVADVILTKKHVGQSRFRKWGALIAVTAAWSFGVALWPAAIVRGEQDAGPGLTAAKELLFGTNHVQGRSELLLFADFADFGCALCLDDFLALCDSLNGPSARGMVGLRLIARRDIRKTEAAQQRLLEGWARANGYTFPVMIDRDSLFERAMVTKTSVVAFDEKGELLLQARFPIGDARRIELIDAISATAHTATR